LDAARTASEDRLRCGAEGARTKSRAFPQNGSLTGENEAPTVATRLKADFLFITVIFNQK
jgi:hypothetical protein